MTSLRSRPGNPTIVLAIVLTVQLMIVLDASIVITALPDIHTDLGFSPTGLSWVQNAYTLTFGGLLLLGARAGRPPRPAPGLRRRAQPVRGRLPARRLRAVGGLAARRPRIAGRRRRDRRPSTLAL